MPGQTAKAPPPALPESSTRKAMRLALWYTKKDRAAYLSQLELQDLFERAFRRIRLPLSFSLGFHPKPVISFSRALPVGVASEGERLALFLNEKRNPEAVRDALGEILPGITVIHAETLPMGLKIADSLEDAYHLEFLGHEAERSALLEAWLAFASLSSLPWLRESKNGIRSLNARSFFSAIRARKDGNLTICCAWENGYISPLALVQAVFSGMNAPIRLDRFRLTKLLPGAKS